MNRKPCSKRAVPNCGNRSWPRRQKAVHRPGAAGAFLLTFQARTLDWKRTKEAIFLTAKTTSMVCWLFVDSALFSAVFAILGGQALLESWVLSLNLTPVQFLILSQAKNYELLYD